MSREKIEELLHAVHQTRVEVSVSDDGETNRNSAASGSREFFLSPRRSDESHGGPSDLVRNGWGTGEQRLFLLSQCANGPNRDAHHLQDHVGTKSDERFRQAKTKVRPYQKHEPKGDHEKRPQKIPHKSPEQVQPLPRNPLAIDGHGEIAERQIDDRAQKPRLHFYHY